MRLPDVNILVYAFIKAVPDHPAFRTWLLDAVHGDEPIALSDVVLSGFLRVSTHPQIFNPPTTLDEALSFATTLRTAPATFAVAPGPRHWDLFEGLCRDGAARGNLVTDAYLAALAIENGCELVTTDRDFARFPRLRWSHPLT